MNKLTSQNPIINQLEINFNHNQPIAAQLADQLTWLIASKQLKPGEKLPSVRDLAAHLDINFHTVQAAYKIMEQASLVQIRRGLGAIVKEYKPTLIARNWPDLPTHTVGFIAPDLSGPFYRAVYDGLQQVSNRCHFLLVSCGTCENPQIAREQLGMLIAKRVDGLIIVSDYLPETDQGPDAQRALVDEENCPIPIVYIDRPDEADHSFVFDARMAGFKATEHLINHGHQSVGLIINDREFPTFRECYQGFLEANQAYGIHVDKSQIEEVHSFSYEAGYVATIELLNRGLTTTALFVSDDMLAIGVIRALRDHNLRVPEDVAIIGMNNIDETRYSTPRITSIDTSANILGIKAMEEIVQRINSAEPATRNFVAAVNLVVRESCGCKA